MSLIWLTMALYKTAWKRRDTPEWLQCAVIAAWLALTVWSAGRAP